MDFSIAHRFGRRVCTVGVLALAAGVAAAEGGASDLRLPAAAHPAAAALLAADRPAEALAALDRDLSASAGGDAPLHSLVLRATLLGRSGREAESEATWRTVASREPALDAYARRALVQSLMGRGDLAAAAAALEALAAGTPAATHLDLTLALARARQAARDHGTAQALYRRVLAAQHTGGLADEARLGLAASLAATGDPPGALATLREAQLTWRLAATFSTARLAERRIAAAAGVPPRPFAESEYADLVRRLRSHSRFEEALAMLEEWRRARGGAGTEDLEADIIDTLYRSRANDEAMSRILAFARQYPRSRHLAQVRLTQFRLDAREGRTPLVRERGMAYWRGQVAGATERQRWSAASLLAAYLVSVGEVTEGLDVYRELYQASRTRADRLSVLWRAGVAALRDGQDQRAATNLRAVLALRPTGETRDAAMYWLGVAEQRLGRRDAAVGRWLTLEREQPHGYYGLRAAGRLAPLRRAGSAPPADGRGGAGAAFPVLQLGHAATHPQHRAAVHLARAGLHADAAAYAATLQAALPGNRAVALLAARAAAAAGAYHRAASLAIIHFRPFLDRPAAGVPDDLQALAYPRAFWDEVRAAAQRQRVDPLILLAIVRQESLFNPAARSPAGAMGLFQVMSYTAEAVGPRAGVDGQADEASLLQPRVSAAIGARLIRELMDLFDEALPAVIAAYNAGEDRAGAWWAAGRTLPEDLFIDTIPYTETRNYVRKVLENLAAYRRIYGE